MPIYDYKCLDCNKTFELLQRIDCKKEIFCKCGGKADRFLSSPPGASFTNPKESSRWENDQYRFEYLLEKGKAERRAADEKFGVPIYPDLIDDSNLPGQAFDSHIDNLEPKIVKYS